jgi:uncharacterized delta-60 repeat protein
LISLMLTLLWAPLVRADLSPGQLDPGFDPGAGADDIVRVIDYQPDGTVLIGGRFNNVDGTGRSSIARLKADGSLDTLFSGSAGGVADTITAIASQPDGKILIGGGFTSYQGTPRNYLARLGYYGALDTSFDPGTGPDTAVEAIAVQPDGKILIAGGFTTYDGAPAPYVARLHPDGTLDTTFDPGAGPNSSVDVLILQPDGKILIGGSFSQVDGATANFIGRLNADGSRDTGFYGSLPARVRDLVLQDDGKIIVGGDFTDGVRRLHAAGNRDYDFDTGTGSNGQVWAVAVQPDGRVLAGGTFTQFSGYTIARFVRLDPDGSVDTTYAAGGGWGADDDVLALALQADGKLLLGGDFSQVNGVTRVRIARLHADGMIDDGLYVGSGATGTVYRVADAGGGKIVVAGAFSDFYGVTRSHIVRLNGDGTVDEDYGSPGDGPNNSIRAVAVQPDGKVIIGGYFTEVDGIGRIRVARLKTDGSLDTTYIPAGGINDTVTTMALQDDGKVVIGGWFTMAGGLTRGRVARLNTDGNVDTTFDPGAGANDDVYAVAVQADGKVVIAGRFTQVAGVARPRVARLNADGSLDTTFDPGTGPNQILTAVAVQPDGKVIIGGYLTEYDGTPRKAIARLNTDGSLDTTFDPGTGADDGVVLDILFQEDGQMLVVGTFTLFDGTTRRRIARLEADGSLNTTFFPGSGANDTIRSVALQPGAKVLIAGDFTSYGGVFAADVARINGGESPLAEDIYPPDAQVGKPYSFTFTATGFPLPTFHVSSGSLPPGLSLDEETGILSGTPTQLGTYNFGFVACNYIAPCGDATTSMDVVEGLYFLPLVLRNH